MSSMLGGEAETQQQQQKGQAAFLSQEERSALSRMLSFPEDLPDAFKSWMLDYVRTNGLQIPIGQISGFPSISRFLDRSSDTVDAVNSTGEQDIYSILINGGTMGTNRMLRLTLLGDILQNANASLTLRVKFGGETIIQHSAFIITNDADRHAMRWTAEIANLGNPQSQIVFSTLLGSAAASLDEGIGNMGTASVWGAAYDVSTIDTSGAQEFRISVQWNVASASASFRKRYAFLELL